MPASPINKLKSFFQHPNLISVLIITGLYFLSRVLGFGRTIVTYQNLTRLEADLLSNADKIPNIIATIFLMGTIFSSVLPVVSRLEARSREEVNRYISIITVIIMSVLVVVLGLCWWQMDWMLELITSKEIIKQAYQAELWDMYLLTARLSLLIPFNFAIQAIGGVLLNFNKKFFIFSLAGTIANIGSIAGLYFTKGDFIKVAIGMITAVSVSSLLYLWACLKLKYNFKLNVLIPTKFISEVRAFGPELRQTIKVFLPRLLLIDGLVVANLIIGRIATSEGQTFAFETAASIQGTFLIIVSSLGMVFFPDLSRILNDKTLGVMVFWEHLSKYLKTAVLLGLFISLLSTFGSYWVMKLFELAGKGQNNADYIVLLAQISSFRLFFQAIKEILDKYMYAKEKQWAPMWLSIGGITGQIVVFAFLSIANLDAGIMAMLMLLTYYMVWCLLAVQVVSADYHRDLPEKYKIYNP